VEFKGGRMKFLERIFESFLWRTRLMVLFAVIFSLIAAFGMFIVASVEIYEPISHMFENSFHLTAEEHEKLVSSIVGASDLFLIATVLIISPSVYTSSS